MGEFEKSQQLLQESLATCKENGNLIGTAIVLIELGEVANLLGEHAEAVQLGQESLTLSKKLDIRHQIAWSFRVLGNATCALRDFQEARRYFQQALEIFATDRRIADALYTLVGVAALLAAEGDGKGAVERLGLVLRHPASAQGTRHRANALLGELEPGLPPAIVAAALERGRARDLEATLTELLVKLGSDRES